jgi:hypothetical protein
VCAELGVSEEEVDFRMHRRGGHLGLPSLITAVQAGVVPELLPQAGSTVISQAALPGFLHLL